MSLTARVLWMLSSASSTVNEDRNRCCMLVCKVACLDQDASGCTQCVF